MAKKDNTMDILNLQFTSSEAEEQLIIFTVGNEEYGLDVLRVQEIIRYVDANQNTPCSRLCGRRDQFSWRGDPPPCACEKGSVSPTRADNDFSVIIVIEMNGKTVGLTVDQVSDILNIPSEQIQVTPEFSGRPEPNTLKQWVNWVTV